MVFGEFCQKSINFHYKRYGKYQYHSNLSAKIEIKHPQFEFPNEGSARVSSRLTLSDVALIKNVDFSIRNNVKLV